MSNYSDHIRTYARIKPVELSDDKIFVKKDLCTIVTKSNDQFMFDRVFDEDFSNIDIYNFTTRPIIEESFHGFNCCILAYGQTFSGKTYTMRGTQQNPGLIPLCLQDIFIKIQQQNLTSKIIVSYFEIYNEDIIDLLSDQEKKIIEPKEDYKKNLVLAGLIEKEVSSINEAMELFTKGEEKRKFGSNNLNVNSSRSHAVFRINVNVIDDNLIDVSSQINLVDLAGSQSLDRTRGEKTSKQQGENINKSLLALTKAIKILSEKKQQQQVHISFRESKLTRILQKSLCENAKSSIVCMINPTSSNYNESINTIKFGQMAAKVRIEARQNLIKIEQSKKHLEMLPTEKMELEEARVSLKGYEEEIIDLSNQIKRLEQENFNKQKQISNYQSKLSKTSQQLNDQKQQNASNREDWWRQQRMLQNRVNNYQEEIDRLEKMNNQLRVENRQLQKNQKGLVQSLQYYQNQCKNLNSELGKIKNKLDQESNKLAKLPPKEYFLEKPKSAPNPFQLQPYRPNAERIQPSKLSWIVKLKIEVIELSRRVNQYTKANFEIAQQNDQLRKKNEQYEQKMANERSSSKINPEALQYNQIKKLKNKIKNLKAELKNSQQRQKKSRSILRKQSGKNLVNMQEFEEWFHKKYVKNYFLEKQIQTDSNRSKSDSLLNTQPSTNSIPIGQQIEEDQSRKNIKIPQNLSNPESLEEMSEISCKMTPQYQKDLQI